MKLKNKIVEENNIIINNCNSNHFYSKLQKINRKITLIILKNYFLSSSSSSWNYNYYKKENEIKLNYLDLFCGIGIRSFLFCQEFQNYYNNVVGIDNNLNSIEIALKNRTIEMKDKVHFYCEDVNSYRINDFFHVIEMDPFGSCLPYINEKFITSIVDGGILNLSFTNTRELFPNIQNDNDNSIYITHGINRPNPIIASHEFGLRSTWVAIYNLIISMNRIPIPICCWSFQHGCRYIIKICDYRPSINQSFSFNLMYIDKTHSFTLFLPQDHNININNSNYEENYDKNLIYYPIDKFSITIELKYVGSLWSGSLIDNELITHILQQQLSSDTTLNHTNQLFLNRLLNQDNIITRSLNNSSNQFSLWGIFLRKSFFQNYFSWKFTHLKEYPSLYHICNLINEKFNDSTIELIQNYDTFLVSLFLLLFLLVLLFPPLTMIYS